MDTGTLIEVVKMIDVRLSKEDLNLEWAHDDNPDFHASMPEYNFKLGQRSGLDELKEYLQLVIEANVSALENDMGE